MSDTPQNVDTSTPRCVEGVKVGASRGARDDQTEAVNEFARRLAEEFPDRDVTIRYNTNRLGGGAWLVHENGRSNIVGLGAELNAPESHKEEFEKFLNGDRDEKPERPAPSERELVFTVHLVVPVIDQEQTNRETSFAGKNDYLHKHFEDQDEAWDWFLENANIEEIPA